MPQWSRKNYNGGNGQEETLNMSLDEVRDLARNISILAIKRAKEMRYDGEYKEFV
jgi:hypothetical protein